MTTQQSFTQDLDKFIEAALYIGERSENDPHFGVSKLVRLLYYSDCAAYILLGKPITGTTYIHFPHGPYPQNWHQARERMEKTGALTVLRGGDGEYYYSRYQILANRPANREVLAPEELELMDEQLRRFANFNAAGIEQYSHQDAAWRATEDGQPLTYEMAGISAPPLSPNSIRFGLKVADDIRKRQQ